MNHDYRTDNCKHEPNEECPHCTEGCARCGELDGLDDDGYCEECALDRAIAYADHLHDSMKEGY